MFFRTVADYAALKSELVNDPASLGFSALISTGNHDSIASSLNQVRSGTAADGKPYSIFRNDISPKEIVNSIASADFSTATALQIQKLNLLFVAGVIDATLTNVRANMQNIFSSASAGTIAALAAIASRNGSRVEVLFGIGSSIVSNDIAIALRQ